MNENQRQFEYLCENLTALRVGQGLSLEQVSKGAGVPGTVLRDIESKVLSRSFSTGHLLRLCKFYEVRPSALFYPHSLDDD